MKTTHLSMTRRIIQHALVAHCISALAILSVWFNCIKSKNRPQEQIEIIELMVTNSQYNNGCRRALYRIIYCLSLFSTARNIEGVELGSNAKQVCNFD